jgi:hypothetical protein
MAGFFGKDTTEKINGYIKRAKEIVSAFGVSEAEAFSILATEAAQRAADVAGNLDRNQKRRDQAEIAAKATELATLKAKLSDKD